MNFKQIILLFEFLILIESSIVIDNLTTMKTEDSDCKNPNKNYLDMIYSEYLSLYRRYEEKIYRKEIRTINDNLEGSEEDNLDFYAKHESDENELRKKFFELTQCDLNDRNR